MSSLSQTMMRLWESACLDAPLRPSCQVEGGRFVLRITGNVSQWPALIKAAGVPFHAERQTTGDALVVSWPSLADEIFAANGKLAALIPGYQVRMAQVHMARLVQRAIELGQPGVVEAGTGVGKSFAYAAICMAMGKKVIISTSNKNLQMQLYRKDVPLLQKLYPGQTVALAVGKGNYACRNKAEDPIHRTIKIDDANLLSWYKATATGNTEEITTAVPWEALGKITVDDECAGKHCVFFHDCFYFDAKTERSTANVVITNHALLCLHTSYPAAGILPPADVLVIDEAHKLADYARNTLGFETTPGRMRTAIQKVRKWMGPLSTQETERALDQFTAELFGLVKGSNEFQLGLRSDAALPAGIELQQMIAGLAEDLWGEEEPPATTVEEIKKSKRAMSLRTLAANLSAFTVHHADEVRWLEPDRQQRTNLDTLKLCAQPVDVSAFLAGLAGYDLSEGSHSDTGGGNGHALDYTQCTRCHRKLTAPVVHLLDGMPYGPECITKVDVLGDAEQADLAQWLGNAAASGTQDNGDGVGMPQEARRRTAAPAVIFCSATLATPRLDTFLRQVGLPDALQMQAQSPFDYGRQALLYVPNGSSPTPGSPDYGPWLLEQLDELVAASRGGAFLLFTSFAMLRNAVTYLTPTIARQKLTMLVQGDLPKLEIARRFRDDGNAVLFATKSFFEGVSIDGDALRLVVVDKMPFDAPSPISAAQDTQARVYARDTLGLTGSKLERYPFDALAVPKMIIELKQASGRLIRTDTDRGVIAILDNRLRTSQYGRNQVLPSLPPAPLVSNAGQVVTFFAEPERAAGKLRDEALVAERLSMRP